MGANFIRKQTRTGQHGGPVDEPVTSVLVRNYPMALDRVGCLHEDEQIPMALDFRTTVTTGAGRLL